MLFNAALSFAHEQGLRRVCIPSCELAIRNTDRNRVVGRALFEKIYDNDVRRAFSAREENDWWIIEVGDNLERFVSATLGEERIDLQKTLCLCHDLERGYGHLESDIAFAKYADLRSPRSLERMLQIEQQLGVKATYAVVGLILRETRAAIESGGHCLAFHSYDHQRLEEQPQLPRCREVDYRIKGYRPPQSKLTAELSDESLCWYNFEWLASSVTSLGLQVPQLQNRVAKIPIAFDDYPMYSRKMEFAEWQKIALQRLEQHELIAFSLHDCYAPFWLPSYPQFLERILALGRLRTLDEVAAELFFSAAR